MKVSDYIAHRLKKESEVVFGYQGSSISHLIDSLCRTGILYIQNYHEQASAFSACGYSEASGKLGIAISCSGPGATNLITGIANAYYDSLPVLFICGQVSTKEFKQNNSRQNGFQQTDIIKIVKPITKYCVEVSHENNVEEELEKCISIAKEGRPGPTLLSLPHDIQSKQIFPSINFLIYNHKKAPSLSLSYKKIEETYNLIKGSKLPVFIIGGGCNQLKSTDIYLKLFKYFDIPVVASLRGINCAQSRNYLGMIGIYGSREANLAVYMSDLIIALGTRLDARQTGGKRSDFAPKAKIIQIDCDENEIGREFPVDIGLNITTGEFIKQLLSINSNNINEYPLWKILLKDIKKNSKIKTKFKSLHYDFIRYIDSLILNKNCVISTDVGQNQMWVAQSIHLSPGSSFLTSGGHGAMGYSLPAIIGAYFKPYRSDYYIAFMGDGGLQMNLQELETIKRLDLKIIIIVLNNNSLGLIRDYQSKALGKRFFGSVEQFSVPSLEKLAISFDLEYKLIEDFNFNTINLESLYGKKILIEVRLTNETNIIPQIAYQHPIYDQEPFINLEFLKKYEDL